MVAERLFGLSSNAGESSNPQHGQSALGLSQKPIEGILGTNLGNYETSKMVHSEPVEKLSDTSDQPLSALDLLRIYFSLQPSRPVADILHLLSNRRMAGFARRQNNQKPPADPLFNLSISTESS